MGLGLWWLSVSMGDYIIDDVPVVGWIVPLVGIIECCMLLIRLGFFAAWIIFDKLRD